MNNIISLAYINFLMYPRILEPWQFNLINPEAYSEPCQIYKMEFFLEIVHGRQLLTLFVKHFVLDIWRDSEYSSVNCYSLFVKTENANKIDSVTV